MSIALIPIITSAGIAAVFNATNNGVEAMITEIALGDSGWSPDNTAGTLQNEMRRLAISGERISDNQIHLSAIEDGITEYWVREVGFYLADGTLLAIWSDPVNALSFKSSDVDLLLSFDLVLDTLPASSVNIDGTAGFNLPAATAQKRGLIHLADIPEAKAGADQVKAMTPATTKSAIDDRIATQGHVNAGASATHFVTPSKMRFGFLANFAGPSGGYIVFPAWLGGLIIQFGKNSTTGFQTFSFPITYPNYVGSLVASPIQATGQGEACNATIIDNSQFQLISWEVNGLTNIQNIIYWISIGF